MTYGFCTPEQIEQCPLTNHFTDVHHEYFPKSDYTSSVERTFRELPENKERLCRNEHNEIHATQEIPEKPTRDVMLTVINESRKRREGNLDRR